MDRVKHPQKLGDHLDDPDRRELSFIVLFDGWLSDLERFHASASAHTRGDWEMVVVDNPVDEEASERISTLERVVHVPLRDPMGFAAGRNLGLRLATGRVVIIVDTSVELTDDAGAGVAARLEDPHVGLVGRWGVSTRDGFAFEQDDGPEVDAVEAYLMATRRALLHETGLIHPKFRFYRNADLDFSFQVRDAGYRSIVDPSVPVIRHAHRLWEATPAEERDELSSTNFSRFRRHWGDRRDLFGKLPG